MKATDERITILAILDGWQEGCWNLAKTHKPFAVDGLKLHLHQPFCEALCHAYDYRVNIIGHRMIFDPVRPATAG